MALIPLQEEKEIRYEDERTVKPQGGFSLEPNTIGMIVSGLLAFYFLFMYNSDRYVDFPFNISVSPWNLAGMFVLAFVFFIVNKSIINFMEYERGVVFRLGKFNRIAGPGWEVVFPLLERYARVDMRLEVIAMGPHEVVTKDKVKFLVSPEIFLYVSNPKEAVLNVQNYKQAVMKYVGSALTHTCGDSTSDYIIAHMNEISDMLTHAVEHMAETPGREWGVIIPRVKLSFVRFPDEVQSAMHRKVASEQLKLAAHEKAEAIKAEINAIREAGSKLTDPALTYMYIDALDKVARGKATKIVLPMEITKIAETMTKRSGVVSPGGGKEAPAIPFSPDIIQKYVATIDDYENRIKQIENKLTEPKKEEPAKPAEPEKKEEKEESSEEKPTEQDDEINEYKDRIREIKKRIGVK